MILFFCFVKTKKKKKKTIPHSNKENKNRKKKIINKYRNNEITTNAQQLAVWF